MEREIKQKITIRLAVSLILAAGCDDKETFSRYPS